MVTALSEIVADEICPLTGPVPPPLTCLGSKVSMACRGEPPFGSSTVVKLRRLLIGRLQERGVGPAEHAASEGPVDIVVVGVWTLRGIEPAASVLLIPSSNIERIDLLWPALPCYGRLGKPA